MIRFLLTFVVGRAFVVAVCWMFMAPCSSSPLLMFEKEVRLCLEASWLVVSGMVFFLVVFVVRSFHVGFVELQMVMVIYFGTVLFLLLLRFVKILNFMISSEWIKGHWPRCLLWHGWLPYLSGVNGASPWAAHAADCAGYLVESALGRYSSGLLAAWSPPFDSDAVEASSLLPDHPNVWTDGSLVLDRVTGVSSAGAGFFAHQPASCWDHRCWGHVDPVGPVGSIQLQGFFLLFLDLSSLFNVLSYGVLFWPFRHLVLSILVLIIWVLFVMLAGCWMVAVALCLLSSRAH